MKNKGKVLIIIFVLAVLGVMSITIFLNQESVKINSIAGLNLNNANEEEIQKIGQEAKVSALSITDRKTGTGPFDENDEAGNDSSENNEIVRSFDRVTWGLEATMALKENSTESNYRGGMLNIEVTLPEECKDTVKWNLDLMKWAENGEVTENGTKFTANYSMSDEKITIPGKQEIVLVLDILGAKNEMTIEPTFKVWLTGNEEELKATLNDNYDNKKVKVSAKPSYNIKLVRNTKVMKRTTVDYGQGNVSGRIYGYSILAQLYNPDVAKGVKGIEFPQGNIKFDVDLNLTRTLANSTEQEDITDECTPILWNYKINQVSSTGEIEGRSMDFGINLAKYDQDVPYGLILDDRTKSTYQSGDINIVQDGRKLNVRMSNYKTDGIFPTYAYSKTVGSVPMFESNVGCLNVSYFQVFVPDNEASTMTDREYYLTATDSNFEATSLSGTILTEQQIITDDTDTVQHYSYIPANFSQTMYFSSDGATGSLGTSAETGDSRATLGQYIEFWNKFGMKITSDDIVNSATKFIKFDGDCVEPVLFTNGEKYLKRAFDGDMTFNVWYITKKDGTNWTSPSEMNEAKIEDMLYFSEIEDIPEGYICIGEYLESITGNITPSSGNNNVIRLRLKVKDDAKVGETYGFTSRTTTWLEYVDRNQYSITKENFAEWPTPTWSSGDKNYVKTEYDLEGNMLYGTHYAGSKEGQSLLILGSDLSVSKTSLNKEKTAIKENFDIGKNEFDVTYKLQANLPANPANVEIKNVDLKIVDVLPKGIKYIAGSANCDEPEVINKADGTTQLVWYLYGKNVGEDIEPIIYKVHIDEETSNGTQYESEAAILEMIGEGEDAKVGNAVKKFRTTTNKINVINLASYASYETTTTPIIEANGNIHFKITVMNKTDRDANEFRLLDILPYNGDDLGSKFAGNYILNKIELSEKSISTSEPRDISDFKLYITNDESVRTDVTAKDNDLGLTSIWEEISSGADISKETTGLALIGKLKSQERLEIDVYLETSGNKPNDIYVNKAREQINMQTEEMQTSIAEVKVIKREIKGKVWFDSNKNGIIDDEENYIEGAKLTLLNEDGSAAKDIEGNVIEPVITDESGSYYFENMIRGNYKVQIEQPEDKKEITLKNVGTNLETNNKFNSNLLTDAYTTLNSIESPVLSINNVNAGITYKDAIVTVHYYLEGTTIKVGEDKTKEGLVDDAYETELGENIPEKYELITVPANSTGTMSVEPTTVIYYYRLKDASVIVHHYLEGTTTQVPSNIDGIKVADETKTGKVDDAYTTSAASNISDKYKLVEMPSNATGIMTVDPINVTYYYELKDAKVKVKYLEKGTNEVLATEETIEGKVDDEYRTVKKTIENYTYVEDTENIAGVMTVEPTEVIYYYLQNTSAKVEYIDKTTGRILNQKTESGLVGDIFETSALDFDNYVLVEEPEEKNVPMQKQEVVLRYYYIPVSGGVIEKHIDVITGNILANEVHEGNEGEAYSIPEREFEGYDLVEERRPSNATGTMAVAPQEVEYYYIRKAKVIVKYIDKITGEELKNEVIKNGHQNDSYTTENETFDGYDLVEIPQNAEGRMEVTAVEENGVVTINNTTEVIYYYIHKSAGVTERHYDVITNELLQEEINHPGHEGDEYSIPAKNFEGYDLVAQRLPDNAKGKMSIGETIVNYYYSYRTNVTTKYIDKITGEEIADREINNGYEGDNYTTIQKTIDDYDFVEAESPEKTEGVMTKNQIEINYYYIRKAKVEVKYVDQTTEKEIAKRDIINGHQNDEYLTTEKEIQYYKLVESTENITGKMEVKVLETEGKKLVNDTTTVIYYYRPLEFNLKVDKTISKILVNGEETNISNNNLAKVEIYRKKLADTTIRVEYIVKVSNDGELNGSTTLIERIPAGFVMKAEDNKDWNINNGIAEIKIDEIKVGETKEYKVVLEWLKGEENIGTIDNIVDIISSKNDAGFEEKTLEDNEDSATVILTVATGENKDEILLTIATAMITILGLIVYISISKKN